MNRPNQERSDIRMHYDARLDGAQALPAPMNPFETADATTQYEIERLLHRYARGVDRRDWDLVRRCYHPDAYDDHGAYRGQIDGLIDWLQRRHDKVAFSMHCVTNVLVARESTTVVHSEAYCTTVQRVTDASSPALAMYIDVHEPAECWQTDVQCRFSDRIERRDGDWRIARRTVIFDAIRVSAVPAPPPFNGGWSVGTRDSTDPSYAAFPGAERP